MAVWSQAPQLKYLSSILSIKPDTAQKSKFRSLWHFLLTREMALPTEILQLSLGHLPQTKKHQSFSKPSTPTSALQRVGNAAIASEMISK
jgi:hypothetical protein